MGRRRHTPEQIITALIPSLRLTIAAVFPFASPTSASLSAVMICSGVCRLLPIVDLPVAATKMPDPNIRTGLVSGGHVSAQ